MVVRQTSPVNVEIKSLDARGRMFITHIDKLKACREEDGGWIEENLDEGDNDGEAPRSKNERRSRRRSGQ